MRPGEAEPSAGLYVHVPFCAHRCGYCDFNVLTGAGEVLRRAYVEALLAELERTVAGAPAALAPPGHDPGPWPALGSVYVGGGTPTRLPAAALARVVGAVRAALRLEAGAEVTVEANPEDVDEAYLATLVAAGVTRLSLGAQSAVPHVLSFLDRRHAPAAVPRAVAAARAAGLSSVSVDLIYGAPAERDRDWDASLEAVLATGVDHVSCYALTLERSTPYAVEVRRGAKAAPDEDVAAARMATADAALSTAGFERYEISNWARPGHASRHNRMYWAQGDYLALGAGAHGHWAGRRWWNLRPTERYVERVAAGRSALGGAEVLSERERREERLLLGLRRAEGVARAAVEPVEEVAVAALVRDGLLRDEGGRLRLAAAGWPLADSVTLRLLGGGSGEWRAARVTRDGTP